jgi:hypothetical protein
LRFECPPVFFFFKFVEHRRHFAFRESRSVIGWLSMNRTMCMKTKARDLKVHNRLRNSFRSRHELNERVTEHELRLHYGTGHRWQLAGKLCADHPRYRFSPRLHWLIVSFCSGSAFL